MVSSKHLQAFILSALIFHLINTEYSRNIHSDLIEGLQNCLRKVEKLQSSDTFGWRDGVDEIYGLIIDPNWGSQNDQETVNVLQYTVNIVDVLLSLSAGFEQIPSRDYINRIIFMVQFACDRTVAIWRDFGTGTELKLMESKKIAIHLLQQVGNRPDTSTPQSISIGNIEPSKVLFESYFPSYSVTLVGYLLGLERYFDNLSDMYPMMFYFRRTSPFTPFNRTEQSPMEHFTMYFTPR